MTGTSSVESSCLALDDLEVESGWSIEQCVRRNLSRLRDRQ